ncbi:hypothetical protein HDU76_013648 [Blyttiomyces sp. JEL0837]|nr:hypothetical protein HDU76_013648 [Blyttiomyces sp. JEL0837]
MASRKFTITVPASTSNIGPGFDVLGIALSMSMSVIATIPAPNTASGIHVTYEGDSPDTVPLDAAKNLVTKTALQVAGSCNTTLPESMQVHIINPIPLGRGLGSSGAAVVAGVTLASEACNLGFSQQRILDYCFLIEGHPDNVTASILGGFVASYKREHPDQNATSNSAPTSVVNHITPPSHTHLSLPMEPPAMNMGRHIKLPFSSKIKLVVTIPEFELQTKLARSVLPAAYPKADVIFNLQRLAVLVSMLGSDTADADVISEAMQDKIHQSYRQHLVPGLPKILKLSHREIPGLIGICVSGAGPTVLALAVSNFDAIGAKVQAIFGANNGPDGNPIKSSYKVLDLAEEGVVVKYN